MLITCICRTCAGDNFELPRCDEGFVRKIMANNIVPVLFYINSPQSFATPSTQAMLTDALQRQSDFNRLQINGSLSYTLMWHLVYTFTNLTVISAASCTMYWEFIILVGSWRCARICWRHKAEVSIHYFTKVPSQLMQFLYGIISMNKNEFLSCSRCPVV